MKRSAEYPHRIDSAHVSANCATVARAPARQRSSIRRWIAGKIDEIAGRGGSRRCAPIPVRSHDHAAIIHQLRLALSMRCGYSADRFIFAFDSRRQGSLSCHERGPSRHRQGENQAMRRMLGVIAVAALLAALAAPAGAGDVLNRVLANKKLVNALDAEYPPFSFLDASNHMDGFDIDVAKEVAKRLGVELEHVTPGWDVITAGKWAGRWDICIGSMTATKEREEVLDFPVQYYYGQAVLLVNKNNTSVQEPKDLAGKKNRRAGLYHLREVSPEESGDRWRRGAARDLSDRQPADRLLRRGAAGRRGPVARRRHAARRHGRGHPDGRGLHQERQAREDRGRAAVSTSRSPSPSTRAIPNSPPR